MQTVEKTTSLRNRTTLDNDTKKGKLDLHLSSCAHTFKMYLNIRLETWKLLKKTMNKYFKTQEQQGFSELAP